MLLVQGIFVYHPLIEDRKDCFVFAALALAQDLTVWDVYVTSVNIEDLFLASSWFDRKSFHLCLTAAC